MIPLCTVCYLAGLASGVWLTAVLLSRRLRLGEISVYAVIVVLVVAAMFIKECRFEDVEKAKEQWRKQLTDTNRPIGEQFPYVERTNR